MAECPLHAPRLLEYYSFELKKCMCSQCIADNNIDKKTLVSIKSLCQDLLQRWIQLLDNATYMPGEHIQKEKEYGIKWRSAFKEEMRLMLSEEREGQIDETEKFDSKTEDPFVFIHKIIKKNINLASERAARVDPDGML